MRLLRTAAVTVALVAALTACSGSGGKDTAASGSGATTATTAGASAGDTTATSVAGSGSGSSTGTAASGECSTLVEAITEMSGTWQIYVQLPGIPDVAEWKRIIEPMGLKHTFTETLDTLSATFGGDKDAADAITYMRTADGIVQKGLGGDKAAVEELKTHIGVNVMEALLKQAPISKELGARGC